MVRVLVVLPTYNEAANIATVLERVALALPEASILVVDDNSPDGTGDIVEKAAVRSEQISLLRREAKSGLGSAYRAGFRWGLERDYDVVVEMDSDFSHDPDSLESLLAPIAEGFEVSIGSRYVPGGSIPNWTLSRRLLSRGGNLYANLLLGLGVADSTAGFRAYAATVLRRIDIDSVRADSYGFQIEMTYLSLQAGARITEVPIKFVDRALGESKMSTYTVVEALVLVSWLALQRLVSALVGSGRSRAAGRRGTGGPARS
ncbi:MAG: polyprenol monophosphomannose synthase [Actinomycetota bacterium]|jgi:dolichol-phosphate mannosyltransferase|nr:polyprenol monophosphomannose synthase [Actinomycetota bacterium]